MGSKSSNKRDRIWLRCETKEFERRTPLSPSDASILVEKGHHIHVESSPNRIFEDELYREAGCEIESPGSWSSAPVGAYVLGLKELPEGVSPIGHRHIYFAHAYKKHIGASALLKRFKDGGGAVFDLEYLHGEDGRRVVTFGGWAGFVGAALGLDILCHQQSTPVEGYPSITGTFSSTQLIDMLSEKLSLLEKAPRIIIIGANGRSGQGALNLLKSLNLCATEWDMQETRDGGPFGEITEYNVFINCVLVKKKIPPLLTLGVLETPGRRLSVIADVSCDAGNPTNSLPIYDKSTTFDHPTRRIISGELPLDVMAIDHLPSLLPAESSADFSRQLLPLLVSLLESEEVPGIWQRAKAYYDENIKDI